MNSIVFFWISHFRRIFVVFSPRNCIIHCQTQNNCILQTYKNLGIVICLRFEIYVALIASYNASTSGKYSLWYIKPKKAIK